MSGRPKKAAKISSSPSNKSPARDGGRTKDPSLVSLSPRTKTGGTSTSTAAAAAGAGATTTTTATTITTTGREENTAMVSKETNIPESMAFRFIDEAWDTFPPETIRRLIKIGRKRRIESAKEAKEVFALVVSGNYKKSEDSRKVWKETKDQIMKLNSLLNKRAFKWYRDMTDMSESIIFENQDEFVKLYQFVKVKQEYDDDTDQGEDDEDDVVAVTQPLTSIKKRGRFSPRNAVKRDIPLPASSLPEDTPAGTTMPNSKRGNEKTEETPTTRRKVTFSNPMEVEASVSGDSPHESVMVAGAGLDAVNGEYTRDTEKFDDVSKYTKKATWRGKQEEFTIFRCQISTLEKHWYISIVPKKSQPGTYSDIDFYSAPANPKQPNLPPSSGWTRAEEGRNQPPTLQIFRGSGRSVLMG